MRKISTKTKTKSNNLIIEFVYIAVLQLNHKRIFSGAKINYNFEKVFANRK